MKLILRTISLPLRHVFRTSHGANTVQENLLVELRDGDLAGYGEGTSFNYYGASAAGMTADLEAARAEIESWPAGDPAALWQRALPLLGNSTFALAALDEAAHDLHGKRLGQPTYRLWGLKLENLPCSDYTLGIDELENTLAILKEFEGWPIYKIKLGPAGDLNVVREVRRRTSAVLRVDANTAWTAEQAIANSHELKALGVEFIEQPLKAGDWQGMKRVFAESALPVIADESCLVEDDVPRCEGYFHGINIKLGKCGGMTPARRMVDAARRLGLNVMMGCMTESSVGISAIAQFLPLLDYVDMDGAVLVARDVASGVHLDHGRAIFPDENGNGVRLLET
jgi:L-alanine-DL-glutamate epimerase-like enolase superfamily enzyme